MSDLLTTSTDVAFHRFFSATLRDLNSSATQTDRPAAEQYPRNMHAVMLCIKTSVHKRVKLNTQTRGSLHTHYYILIL